MRIDKYLWCIRVFKTRGLSATACKTNKVMVNDVASKPSREIEPGQEIKVRKGPVWYTYRVTAIPKSRVGAKLVPDYCEDLTPEPEKEKLVFVKMGNQYHREPGAGRPTKKERRTLDRFRDGDAI